MIECDEIITFMDTVSTKMTIATNVMITASINYHCIKVKDCYILHIVFLATILLLIIIIICYHYAKKKVNLFSILRFICYLSVYFCFVTFFLK